MIKKLVGAVVGLGILVGVYVFFHLLINNKLGLGYNQGYQPTQPLPYSHKLHAGDIGLDCKYCHAAAEVSRHSSVPSLNICMNCHLNVIKQSDALTQLKDAYNNNTGIAWTRIYMLPNHVKFNHAPHVKAGKECQTCHGPVETMEKVYQYTDLSMGWCVNCHREEMDKQLAAKQSVASQESPEKVNFYNSDEAKYSSEVESSNYHNGDWVPSLINCSTCHY